MHKQAVSRLSWSREGLTGGSVCVCVCLHRASQPLFFPSSLQPLESLQMTIKLVFTIY